jgi:pimeloyl-ACP methyl ester carboxylesterase
MRHEGRMTPPLPEGLPLEEATLDAAGVSLRVRVWGDRAKPAVLLQHGGKDHGRSWDWTVRALSDAYCLVVPDLRGHGDSGHAPGSYTDASFTADLALVARWVAGWQEGPLAIVGHSLGGNVALRLAAAFPEAVSRLVCIEGLGFSQARCDEILAEPMSARLRKAVEKRLSLMEREPRVFEAREEAAARMAKLHPHLTPAQAEHLAFHALRRDGEGWRWKHDPHVTALDPRPTPPAEYLPLYADVACPVLLMYGKDSWASSPAADGRMGAFRDARLLEYEGAGHWLHHDAFDRFVGDVRAFLEG